jgi:hypothetical protein
MGVRSSGDGVERGLGRVWGRTSWRGCWGYVGVYWEERSWIVGCIFILGTGHRFKGQAFQCSHRATILIAVYQ